MIYCRRPIVPPCQAHINFSATEVAYGSVKLYHLFSSVRLVRLTSSQGSPLSAVALTLLRVLSVILLHIRTYGVAVLLSPLRGLLFDVISVLFVPLDDSRLDPLGIVLPILPTVCVSSFLVLVVPLSRLVPDSLGVFVVVLFLLGFQLDIVLFAVTSVGLSFLVLVTSSVVSLILSLKLRAGFTVLFLGPFVSTESGLSSRSSVRVFLGWFLHSVSITKNIPLLPKVCQISVSIRTP